GAGQAAARPAVPAVAPGQRLRLARHADAGARSAGRPERADADRRRLPGPGAAAVRLPIALRRRQPAAGGALPAAQRPAPVVPAGLGSRPGGMAHLPGRPDRAADADRPAVQPPGAPGRGRDRGAGGSRDRRGDLALPGPRRRACAGGPRTGPTADPGRGPATGRRPVHFRARLGPSPDARALPRAARRRLRGRGLARARRRPAYARRPLPARHRRPPLSEDSMTVGVSLTGTPTLSPEAAEGQRRSAVPARPSSGAASSAAQIVKWPDSSRSDSVRGL